MIFYNTIRNFPTADGFTTKLQYLASLMGVSQDWILLTMHSETAGTFRTDIRNSKSGAVGLIQFLPKTAQDLGTTVTDLAAMTHEQQMDYVIQYFLWFRHLWPKIKSASDVYLIVFYPYAIGQSCNFVLGSESNRVKVIYRQNSFIDTSTSNDGVLTRADFLEWFYGRYKRYEKDGVYFERCTNAKSYAGVVADSANNNGLRTVVHKTIDYEEIVVTDVSIQNVQGILDKYDITMTAQEFLDYKENSKAIYSTYRKEDKATITNGGKGYRKGVIDLVRPPVKLKIPIGKYNKAHLYKKTSFQKLTNTEAFVDEYVKELLSNPNYIQVGDGDVDGMSRIFKQQDNISVYIWCKALGETGRLIDVSLFVESVRTYQGKTGGNFAIQLAPVRGKYNDVDGWHIPTESFEEYIDEYGHRVMLSRNPLHQFQDSRGNANDTQNKSALERTKQFFQLVIQSNDIVFVRFKNLKLENNDKERYRNVSDIYMDLSELPGKVYDLIGMVDKNTVVTSAENSNISVNVVGRDVTKTIIEDGSYFFPISFNADQTRNFFQNAADDNRGIQRIQGTGNAKPDEIFNAYLNNSIGDIIQYILTKEATMQVCPDEVFDSYPESEKSTIAYISQKQVKGEIVNENRLEKAAGIWQICKIAIDPKVTNRLISNHIIGSEQGSLLSHINQICQDPFVEFFTDTYGDKFYFIARVPPFDYNGFKSGMERALANETFHISDHDIYEDGLEFNDQNIPTWYRLTPQANYFGNTNNMALTYLQAVFLNEYAEIWGSRAMDIITTYINFDSNIQNDQDSQHNLDYLSKQSQEDLQFMIETTAYIPFTREGTLTIRNNRTIKRGHFIYLVQTDEVGYVEEVTHSWSISLAKKECNTILKLSRIIKRQYFDFYFRIVNLDKNKGLETSFIADQTPNASQVPMALTFEKNGIYLLDDKKLETELDFIKSDYGYDDVNNFKIFLQDRELINTANVNYLVRVFTDKMNVKMELVMYPTDYDDTSNLNLNNVLATRGQIIKNKIVSLVKAKTGRDVSDRITFSTGSYQSNDNSADFESIATITIERPNKRKADDKTQYKVNRDIFEFFIKRKQFA